MSDKYKKYINFIEKYKKASNASSGSEVDANANVEVKNITTMTGELFKREAIGTNRELMVSKITELFGEELANEYIRQLESHEIYRHDETSIYSYCASITLYPFLFNGLTELGGLSEAPKHLDSFAGAFINLVFAVAAQFAGAIATPEFLTYTDYFIRKEYGDDYYLHTDKIVDLSAQGKTIDTIITDTFQQVVYSLNQPAAARNFQSVFWNIAYFDKPYFESIFKGFVFPDGTAPKWESLSWLQKRFMKWFNAERLKKVLTFPVETVNLLDDGKEYVDKEWADFAAEMYSEGHSFFTYRSNSVDALASCCFDGKQKVTVKYGDEPPVTMSFRAVYAKYDQDNDRPYVCGRDRQWHRTRPIRTRAWNLYKITTRDGRELVATEDHIHPLYGGSLKLSSELTVGDSLIVLSGLYGDRPDPIVAIKPIRRKFLPFPSDDSEVFCFQMPDGDDPYFLLANGIVTHNCRLRNEVQENVFSYTLGAGGISTGSKGVITINVNRLVQNAVRDGAKIEDRVREQVEKIHKYLIAWNAILHDFFKSKLLPVYDAGFIALDKQYLTIGINGFIEAAEFLGIDISPNQDYFKFGETILKPIYELNRAERTKETMFNTEFVPAENLGVKNAKWDKADGYMVSRDCYNSYFYKVEDEDTNLLDKFILHGDRLTRYLDGGSALHANLEEHLTKEQYRKLLDVAIRTGCSYFTFNIPNTICNECGHISKRKLKECPKCGSKNLDYATRVIGYLKRVSAFSEARQAEEGRRYYDK